MRTAVGIGLFATLLAASPAAAMVPPLVQQRGELHQLIDLPALARLGLIQRIERIAPDIWRVTGGNCHVDVRMVERAGPYPGRGLAPPQLEPRPGRPVCTRQG